MDEMYDVSSSDMQVYLPASMPYPKRARATKPNTNVDVETVTPLDEGEASLGNELELDVNPEAIHEHELLEDDSLIEGSEEVEVEYVDDNGIPVPEMAEEVVMEGDYVEEYIEEPMHEDDMAESLVALSRSGEYRDKGGAEFVVDNLERRRQPRILRRFTPQHQQYADQSYVDSRHILVDDYQPVASAGRDTRFTPKYPVAVARRGLPSARSYPRGDWREDQCKKLLVCDVFESLPEHKHEAFRKLMDIMGTSVPGYRSPSKRKYPENSPGYYPDTDPESLNTRQAQKNSRSSNYGEGRFAETPRFVVTSPTSRSTRVLAMIPFEEKVNTENAERVDTADMPELIQNDIHEGERSVDNDVDEGGDVDIETYEEDTSREQRKTTLWLDNKGRVLDVVSGRGVTYPEMREETFGCPELRVLPHSKDGQDERFCPSCRMTMKRSIYYHHGRLIRKYGRCDIFTPKRFPCGSPGCHERLGTLERLCEHMYQVHRAPTDIKRKVFENETQFEEFLRELESRGGNFRMSRGNKTIKEGIVQYFRCNRIFSIAKDKALRIVDDINAGTYEAIKDITQPMDPFGKETSTKPYLRTEEACTAFFRKTYLNDGTIEVRYCDYHLHGDERLRLPTAIRNRIYEMTKKRLPLPVIVMVLQRECHRFCMPGTALERRIMAVTPREVQLVAQSVQRRLDSAMKRKRLNEAAGHEQNANGEERPEGEHEREDHEAAENILEPAEADDSHENLIEMQEDDSGGSQETALDFSTEGRGEGGELTELELAMLEEYERNRGVILTDFQSLKREENRKRLCRERVRAKIYTLGRAMRNIQFSDFECDLLIRSEQMLEGIVDMWNERMEASCKGNQKKQQLAQAANDELPSNKRETSPLDNKKETGISTQRSSSTSDVAVAGETPAAADSSEPLEVDTANTSEEQQEPVEGGATSEASPSDAATSSAKASRSSRIRQRRTPRAEKQVKEEYPSHSPTPSSSPPPQPAVSRLGRVIKRRKILDV
ncbi:C2H2-type domain-containing protein [Trichostrongylus colubriformis]|uniref:C2H2-type domain-containing protein n=1 Tax=Trichostrongylus colubriformis TaxID=6319 RepID=A0AAN8IIL5_TRICO